MYKYSQNSTFNSIQPLRIARTAGWNAIQRFSEFPQMRTLYLTCFFVLFYLEQFSTPGADAFFVGSKQHKKPGLLKLCPPGGESFATAWQITCGMRRKKRDVPEQEMALNGTEIEAKVAEDAAQTIAGLAISNPEPLLTETPKKKVKRYSNDFPNGYFDLLNESKHTQPTTKPNAAVEMYRAPSMTEMMMVCCRYGCSLRDLLPYCDPFGQWDS